MAGPYKSLDDLDAAMSAKEQAKPYQSIGDLDAAISQSDANDQQRLGFSAKQSLAVKPDQYIKARDLGGPFGIPPDVAERNLPEVEYRNKLDALIGTMQKSPALGGLMQDPGYLKRTHDDIEALAQIELETRGFKEASMSLRKRQDDLRNQEFEAMIGRMPMAPVPQDVAGTSVMDETHSQNLMDSLRKGALNVAVQGEVLATLIDRALASAGSLVLPKPEAGGDVTVDSTTQQTQAALVQAAEAFAAAPSDKRMEVAGRIFEEAYNQGQSFKGLGDAIGYLAQNPAAVLNFMGEMGVAAAPGLVVGGGVTAPFRERILSSAMSQAMKSVASKAVTGAGVGFFANMAPTIGGEISEGLTKFDGDIRKALDRATTKGLAEGSVNALFGAIPLPFSGMGPAARIGNVLAETAYQATGGAAGAAAASASVGEEISVAELFLEAIGEGFGAPADLAVSARQGYAYRAATEMFKKGLDSERSLQAEAKLTQMVDVAAQTASIARDPSAVQELVNAADEDGQTELYINARQFANVFNQSPVETAAALGVTPEALNDALASNTDIVVPLSTFTTAVARDQALRPIIEHTRVDPGDMSPSEARLWQSQQGDQFKAEAEAVLAKRQADETFKAEVQQVHDNLLGQLNQAGRWAPQVNQKYAAMVRDFYVTMADRAGMTVSEMAAKYPLRVVAEGQGALQQGQGGFDRVVDLFGNGSRVQYFNDRKGVFVESQQYPNGKTKWRAGDVVDGLDSWLSDKEFASREEAEAAIRGLRVSNTLKAKNASKYGGIPNLWKGEEKKVAKALIDAGFAIDRFSTSTQSRSKYLYLENGVKVRLADHTLPNSYDAPDVDFRYGGDIAALVEEVRAASPAPTLQQSPLESTPGFEQWSHGHPVIRIGDSHEFKAGEGVVVEALHGTTGDFTAFNRAMANIESDLGGGFYFTNNPADVGENYAGLGPDLTQKVELEYERQQQFLEDDEWSEGKTDEEIEAEARRRARQQFMANEGFTMPVFIRFDNPVVLGGSQETFLDIEESYNEETDEYGEPTGKLVDFVEALRDVGQDDRYGDADVEQAIADLWERAADNGGLTARELIEILSASEGLQYASDYENERGALASKEIIRKAFEATGFNGFIDQTVNKKFGSEKRIGKPMAGMDENTVHFIAFKPEQIKSRLGNSGAFSETDPDILKQGGDQARANFDPSTNTIALLEGADWSSFLHESAHFFLEVMADLASRPDAPASIRKDFETALAWMGVPFDPIGGRSGAAGDMGGTLEQGPVSRAELIEQLKKDPNVYWHGSPSGDLRGGHYGLHLGSYEAAKQALEARIGTPLEGEWDGTREYGKTMLSPGVTGFEAGGEPRLPTGKAVYSDGTPVAMDSKPNIVPFRLTGKMTNTRGRPHEDYKANGYMKAAIKKGSAKSGYFYTNEAEDAGSVSVVVPSDAHLQRVDDWATYYQGGPETETGAPTTPLGRTAAETWAMMSLDEKRPYHEKWARGYEAYLFEGVAPSVEMQGIFQRFSQWLKQVYTSLKALNVELTDDVRGVFDRMLASEDAIKTAEAVRNFAPIFQTAEQAGMTAEEWEQYQAEGRESTDTAVDELQARSIRDMRWQANAKAKKIKELQATAKELRAEVKIDVRREVLSQPLYRAWQFLTGKNPDQIAKVKEAKSDPNKVDPTKDTLLTAIAKLGGIDLDQAVSEWGLDPADANAKADNAVGGKRKVVRKEGGRKLDAMAEALAQYGYLETDATGKWDNRQFEEMFFDALRGGEYFSQYGEEAMIAAATREAQGDPDAGITLENTPAGKLNTEMLKGMYGETDTAPWRLLSALRMTSPDGLAPDQVADLFGFTSGDDLVRRLAVAEDPKALIDQLTDQRMLELHGDLATPAEIELAAERAIHNDVRARVLTRELNALRKATGQGNVMLKAARMHAEQWLARQTVRNATRHAQHVAAEGRAARASAEALKAGDTAAAAVHKRDQLLNNQLARGSIRAGEEVRRAVKYLKKFDKAGSRKAIDQDYLDQIDQLLERFDLRQVSGKALEKRASLAAWLKQQEEMGLDPVIDAALVEEAQRQHYSTLTLEEFRGLVDSIQSIEHMGRLKNRLLTAKDKREFKAVKDELVANIIANANRSVTTTNPITPLEKGAKILRNFSAMHRKFASIIREMDGGQDGGKMWEYLVRTMNDAGDAEVEMRGQMSEKFANLFSGLKGIKLNEKVYIPALKISLRREELLSVALNSGNEGNVQRLLDGGINESLRAITYRQLFDVLNMVTPQEWDFVEGVWAMIEANRPAIAAQEKALTGVEPKWVEPTPFTLASGRVIRGGYYPAKYNADMSTRSNELEAVTDLRQQMMGAGGRAATRKSYTEARAAEVSGRPMRLDLGVIAQHINEVTHRLAWQEWLIDARRILHAPDIDRAIRDHYGPEILAQLKKQLVDIAAGDNGPTDAMDRVMAHLRNGTTIAGMGWNIMTSLMQPIGLTQSVERIGVQWLAKGLAEYMRGNPFKVTADVHERSSFMANRAKTLNREINDVLNQIKSERMSQVEASYFYLIQKFQQMVDVPTWLGAYEKAIADGNADDRAVALADQAVIDSQGAGQLKDLAAIQRGSAGQKLFTAFYSFFSTTYNRAVENYRATDFRNPLQVGKLAANYLLLFTLPAVWGWALKEALRGDDDDEDAAKIAKRLAAEQLNYLLGTMVLVREIGGAISGFQGYQGPAGTRFFAELGKFIKQAQQGDVDMALVKAAANTVGVAAHLPSGQVIKSVEGTVAVMDGKAGPQAILVGPPLKN